MDLIQTLRSVAIFQHFPDSELEQLSRSFEERKFAAKAMIFKEKDPGNEVFVIAEGSVQIFRHETDKTDFLRPEGKETEICKLKAGDCFGEIAALGGETRTTSARAITPTKTWVLRRDPFEAMILQSPKTALEICRVLASYLHRSSAKPLDLQRLC